jgi:MFS family permease
MWIAATDIAPDYAGSASALMNAAGAVAGILSPVVFGFILDRTGRWTLPFAVSLALLLAGGDRRVVDPPRRAVRRRPAQPKLALAH